MTAADVMREVRNTFPACSYEGVWTLDGGRVRPEPEPALLPGDWIALSGSLLNDGIWQLDAEGRLPGARDETFRGEVWLLRPPAEFLELCAEIADWAARNAPEPVTAERFGDYSQTRATDRWGLPVDWRDVFRARLLPWRRMFGGAGL